MDMKLQALDLALWVWTINNCFCLLHPIALVSHLIIKKVDLGHFPHVPDMTDILTSPHSCLLLFSEPDSVSRSVEFGGFAVCKVQYF